MAEVKSRSGQPLTAVCRCCLATGCYKDISSEYFWMGKREVYAEMLKNTFDLSITVSPKSRQRLICDACISRLRDAADFKMQVEECDKSFVQYLEVEESDGDVKEEKHDACDYDDTAGVDDDDTAGVDDDDMDDQPLTNFMSNKVKEEPTDLIELLESATTSEATIKRKKSSITLVPSKKMKIEIKKKKKQKVVKAANVPKVQVEKKNKDPSTQRSLAKTSVWQMTVSERQNAATFLEFSTVKPFFYQQANFKCFYCNQAFPEVNLVFQHTSVHITPDRNQLLKEYLTKGKRVIKVDISDLKCKICELKCSDLDDLKIHLIDEHNKVFNLSSNGLMAYNLSATNGFLSCHKCDKKFNSFFLLNRHMNVHFSVVCETCGLGFMSHQRLINHRIIHQNGVHQCNKCEGVFSTKLKLRYHVLKKHDTDSVKKSKPLKCPHCLERFAEHYKKMTHLKEVHEIKFSFECQCCKSVFPTRRALTEHTTKLHTQKNQCKTCGKCFGTKSLLKMHMRGHSGERNFFCSLCHKSYMHERTLRQHMRVHGQMWKFNCNDCGSGFHNRNDFNKHVKQWHGQ